MHMGTMFRTVSGHSKPFRLGVDKAKQHVEASNDLNGTNSRELQTADEVRVQEGVH